MRSVFGVVAFLVAVTVASTGSKCNVIRNATACTAAGCSACMGNASLPSSFVSCFYPNSESCCLAADRSGSFGGLCDRDSACCSGVFSVACCSSDSTCCSDGLFGFGCIPNGFFSCSGCSPQYCPDAGKCDYCLGTFLMGCQMPNGSCIPTVGAQPRGLKNFE